MGKYDISFFKKYFQFFKSDRYQILDILNVSENQLDKYIYGEKNIDEDTLNKLLDFYGYYNYDELKENINNKRRNKQIEITMKKYNQVSVKNKPVIKEEKSSKKEVKKTSSIKKEESKSKKRSITTKNKPIIKNDIQPKKRKGRQISTAYDLIGCTKEEFEKLKKNFTEEDKRIYKRAIGEDDDNPVRCEGWSIGIDKVEYQSFISRKRTELKYLNDKSDNPKRGKIPPKKLYELLGCTKEELQNLKKDFTNEDKRIYKRAIGEDDDNPVRCEDWNYKEDKVKYNQFIARQRRKLKEKKVMTIYERIGCTKEEYMFLKLTLEDKDLIKRKNGNDLDKPKRSKNWTQKDKENYNLLIRRLQTQIKHIRDKEYYANNKGKGTVPKPLKELISCTQKEIDYLLSNLSEKEKDLYDRATGDDPSKPKRSDDWSDKDRNEYANFTKKKKLELEIIRYLYGTADDIDYTIPPKTIENYINATKEEIDLLTSKLYVNQKSLYERVINYEGTDIWSLNDTKKYYYFICDRKRKLENIRERSNNTGRIPFKASKLLNCSKSELNQIISVFNEEEQDLFERANGNDLDNPRREFGWSSKDQDKYHNLIKKYKRYLKKERDKNINKISECIKNQLKKEEYNDILEYVSMEDFIIAVLKIKYGFLNSSIESSLNVTRMQIIDSSRKVISLYRQILNDDINKFMKILDLSISE